MLMAIIETTKKGHLCEGIRPLRPLARRDVDGPSIGKA
jgi:hypothetical protein